MATRAKISRQFWDERKVKYPFRLKTPYEQAPGPVEVEMRLGTLLLRVPLKSEGIVLWGFKTKMEADAFREVYGASDFSVTEVE